MELTRSSGVLLHATSLPGPYGIGDIGSEATRFVEFLTRSEQSFWQVLPLHPTSRTHSPYQAYSAFAGNPLLISPDRMVENGLVPATALEHAPRCRAAPVDFMNTSRFKTHLLRQSYRRFKGSTEFAAFCSTHAEWLEHYALFMALQNRHRGLAWNRWERALAARRPRILKQAAAKLEREIGFYKFVQFVFFSQYQDLKQTANQQDIRMIGDLPIFVSHNSADVWANQHLFHLDRKGEPALVAGVPPDYFSKTGQRWGNPLYCWEKMEQDGYAWWRRRLGMALKLYDVVRIDHFRGFEAYWAIPAQEKTAVAGTWVRGPGAKLFQSLRQEFGDLPIIAEDLGLITPKVEKLRDRFRLPGMKVLQFAFSEPANVYLPHNYTRTHCIVYTGTHDNDTTRGWWDSVSPQERRFARQYLRCPELRGTEISWELIRLAMRSVAKVAIFPLQDLMNLGKEARMNTPGIELGNWAWRYQSHQLTTAIQDRLRELTSIYGRAGNS